MNDCEGVWNLVHAEIRDIGESAARLALATYPNAETEDLPNVIAASVTMTLVDVFSTDPDRLRNLIAEFHIHTRRHLDQIR